MEVRAMKRAGERSLGTGGVRRARGRAERGLKSQKMGEVIYGQPLGKIQILDH